MQKIILMFVLTFSNTAFGKTTLERVKDLGVSNLPGKTTVYFSGNARMTDVTFTQALVGDAVDFYARSPEVKTKLEIYPAILNQTDWESLPVGESGFLVPYGIPALSDDKPFVAFIGATDDNILTYFNLQMEASLPQYLKDRINQAGFSYIEGAQRMPFLVATHEMGHAYLRSLGIGYPRNHSHTLDEVLANYLLYAYLRANRPKLAQLWDSILEGYVVTQCPPHTTIKDFDELYFEVAIKGGPGNFFWYQGMVHKMAIALYESEGLGFIKKMDEIVALSDKSQVYQKLTELNPKFQEWIDGFGPSDHCN